MGIIVQKFGGSSVANTERLENVCKIIKREINLKNQLVVVVSAQGKTTDKLIQEEAELDIHINKREHDALVSVGEQITMAKLSMLLGKHNIKAISLAGWQVPIITNSNFTDAEIKYIGSKRIKQELARNKVVVVAGFQGVDKKRNITTLRKRPVLTQQQLPLQHI